MSLMPPVTRMLANSGHYFDFSDAEDDVAPAARHEKAPPKRACSRSLEGAARPIAATLSLPRRRGRAQGGDQWNRPGDGAVGSVASGVPNRTGAGGPDLSAPSPREVGAYLLQALAFNGVGIRVTSCSHSFVTMASPCFPSIFSQGGRHFVGFTQRSALSGRILPRLSLMRSSRLSR
jgi:hypothetical protein